MTRLYRLNGEVKPLLKEICEIDVKDILENSFGYESIDSIDEVDKDVDVAIVFNADAVVTDIADIIEFGEELDESTVTNFGCYVIKGNVDFKQQADFYGVYSVTDIKSVASLSEDLRLSILQKHVDFGVEFESFDDVYIGKDVEIQGGAKIERNVTIKGNSKIGKGAVIGSGSVIINAEVKAEADVKSSRLVDCVIGEKTTVGPYANIHTGSKIDSECRIGNFVEIKNSMLGYNTKSAHLAYIGDSDIGYKCNIGCGVIFVNYDGENKHRSVVGNGVFIGSNSNVVAPVNLKDGAYVAAGTTVTCDLPENCMCIGRSRETIKENRSKYHKLDK